MADYAAKAADFMAKAQKKLKVRQGCEGATGAWVPPCDYTNGLAFWRGRGELGRVLDVGEGERTAAAAVAAQGLATLCWISALSVPVYTYPLAAFSFLVSHTFLRSRAGNACLRPLHPLPSLLRLSSSSSACSSSFLLLPSRSRLPTRASITRLASVPRPPVLCSPALVSKHLPPLFTPPHSHRTTHRPACSPVCSATSTRRRWSSWRRRGRTQLPVPARH